jgi:hypothetical protein
MCDGYLRRDGWIKAGAGLEGCEFNEMKISPTYYAEKASLLCGGGEKGKAAYDTVMSNPVDFRK